MRDTIRKISISLICIFCGFAATAQTHSLNDYLEAGEANSPLLQDYQNQAAIASLENKKVRANYRLPSVHSNINWMEAPVIKGVGYDEAISNGSLYSALAGVDVPLFMNAFMKSETEQNNLQANRAQWQQQTSSRDLKKQITDNYAACYADQQLYENGKQQLDLVLQQYKLSQKLAKEGLYKASDILLLKIEVANQQVQVQNFYAQLKNDLNNLNTLCAITDTTVYPLADPGLTYVDTAVAHSGYLQQFTLDSLNAKNYQRLFELKYKPQLSAFADAGLNTSTLNQAYNYLGFSFGLNFSVTLFDGKQRKVNSQQTDLKLKTVAAYHDYFIDQRHQELNNSLQQIEMADQRISNLQQQLHEYESVLNLYRDELGSGEISITDYLVVLRNSVQAQQSLIYQQLQKNIAINAFNYWNW